MRRHNDEESRTVATVATSEKDHKSLVDAFERLNGHVPQWVGALRERAFGRFRELGFPATNVEDWKYTDVRSLAAQPLHLAGDNEDTASLRRLLDDAGLTANLVFVNGRFRPDLSTDLPPARGVTVSNLAAVLRDDPSLIEGHLGRYADFDTQHFTALNTAFLQDGAVISLAAGAHLDDPLHVLYVTSASNDAVMSHPRNLIVAGEGSKGVIIETYAGAGQTFYCTNALTEISLETGAEVTHYRVQEDGPAAFHIGTVETRQGAGSRFSSWALSVGAALARTDVNTAFDAEEASCSFDGLYVAGGRQHVDHHTCIDHRQPHCTSRQLYKGILDDRSSGVFNGKVFVRPQAQKSDAAQINKNLLLSEGAVIDTKPQLEIFADDVRCSHGATVGRLDEEAAFYLRSRGISQAEARNMLVYAFANELIDRLPAESLQQRLRQTLSSRLGGGDGAGVS
jgi:Fe-S cluster assembly protein SufD